MRVSEVKGREEARLEANVSGRGGIGGKCRSSVMPSYQGILNGGQVTSSSWTRAPLFHPVPVVSSLSQQ